MDVAVLGPLLVAGAGNVSRRDRVVLAALAVRSGHPVRIDELADALWGEHPPSSAHKVVQGCIVRLRKALGAEAIQTSTRGYVLAIHPDQLDSQRFERQVVRARELLGLGQADRASYQLTEALALWNGDAFSDLEEWQPAVREARRLDELRLEAEELRVEAMLRTGRHAEVLAEVQALVRAAPLREHRWVLQAHAQYQSGQQGEALRTLHQLRSVLATRLGVDPGPDVVTLEQSILRQDPSLLAGGTAAPSGSTCPYQGLQAFDITDADRFFGRQGDVQACLGVLRRTPLLALVGPSGSGKSSLMRAGVGASLRARGTPTVVITPGARPVEGLTELAGVSAGTTLLVDQLEELFSLCDDPGQRQEFLWELVAQTEVRPVVVALRADHLADLAAYPDVARLVERGLYIVGGLSEEGLAQAIEAPARQSGLVIEAGLVDLLVREVKDDPGALPLLSHVLQETWRRREGNTLTVAGYRASGGIHGAVAQSAEALYARVAVDQRHTLRDLVLRLVTPGPQGEPVRSRVPRRMVATDTERDHLIEQLVAARLVTSDDGVLEITHEALAREWPRLRGWLDDDIEGQRMLHHVSAAADAWESMGRPDSELYRGVRLARIRDWRAGSTATLTDTEQAFLASSQEQAEAEERSAEERANAQSRLIRRLRVVLTGAVVLLVLALAAGGVAAVQSKRAGDNAVHAREAESVAEAQALTAQARGAGLRAADTEDVDESLLLGAAAARLVPSPESTAALSRVLAQQPALLSSTALAGQDPLAMDLSPDGRVVATVDAVHRVRLLDLETGELLADRPAGVERNERDEARSIAFTPDGRMLAVGQTPLSPDPVALLDGQTLAAVGPAPGGLPRGHWRTVDVSFSGDGRFVAAALQRTRILDGTPKVTSTWAFVWRLDRRTEPMARRRLPDSTWTSLALSPNGSRLYAMPARQAYDLRTGERSPFFPKPTNWASGIALSPDGTLLAFGAGVDQGAAVVSTRSMTEVRRLGLGSNVSDVRFDGDGGRLLTTNWGSQRSTQVWSIGSGRLVADLTLSGLSEQAVDLDAGGRTIVSAEGTDADGVVRRWDVTGSRRYLRRIPVRGFPWPKRDVGGACWASPSPGGEFVAYLPCAFGAPDLDGSYLFLDVHERRAGLVRHAISGWHVGGGTWRPELDTYLRADGGFLREYAASEPALLRAPHPLGNQVSDVDYSPDGTVVVAAETSGEVTRLDADTLEPRGVPVRLDDPAIAVAAGPDNRTAIVATVADAGEYWSSWPRRWSLVDLQAGEVLREGDLGFDGNWVAYSPDGRHAVATGWTGEVLVIDLDTGRAVRPFVTAHGGPAMWATFSSDGSRMLTAAEDGSVALWDTDSATQLAAVTLPITGLTSAEFRRDGDVLVVPWAESAVYVWDPAPARAVAFACRAAGRELTEEEWREVFGDLPQQEVCADR